MKQQRSAKSKDDLELNAEPSAEDFAWVRPGKSILLAGPPGSGKSTFVRSMLRELGGGAVALAPGVDEAESYSDFYDAAGQPIWNEKGGLWLPGSAELPYLLAPFDDEGLTPTLGRQDTERASGFKRALRFLKVLKQQLSEDRAAGRAPRYPVFANDTFTGIGDLCYNEMLAIIGSDEPPKARGENGATFYGGYKTKMQEYSRVARGLRMLGVHWVATAHVYTREVDKKLSAQDVVAKEQVKPIFTGAYRDQVAGQFDLVFFTGIGKDGKPYMQWRPSMDKAAKSRVGDLSKDDRIENTWPALEAALKSAKRPV